MTPDSEKQLIQQDFLEMAPETALLPSRIKSIRLHSQIHPAAQELTFAEFFAGIGLVRLALEAEGWRAVFSNDLDPDKKAIYEKNFSAVDFSPEDIRKLKADSLPSALLTTASFPCTDLSLAGERRGLNGEQSGTIWSFFDLIRKSKTHHPKLILLENVVGLLSSHKGSDFRAIVATLNSLGFECDAFIVNAVHFVPQSRPRLFLLAFEKGASLPYETVITPSLVSAHPTRPTQLLRAFAANADLSWRFARTPPPLPSTKPTLRSIIESIPATSELWWDSKRKLHILSQLSPRHKAVVRHLQKGKKDEFLTAYKRMRGNKIRAEIRSDGIAGCLRTPRGGSSRQIVFQVGGGQIRVRHMTPREYARLQGVPDSYKLDDSVSKSLFGFGDAVCVPAVRWLARNLIIPAASSFISIPNPTKGNLQQN